MLERRYWHVASKRVGKPRVGYLENGVAQTSPPKNEPLDINFTISTELVSSGRGVGEEKGIRSIALKLAEGKKLDRSWEMNGPRETSDEFLKGEGAERKKVRMVARIVDEKDTLKDVEKVLIYGVFARGYASVDSPKLLLGAVTVPHEGSVTSFSSLPPLESHHTNIPHHRVNRVSFAAFPGQMIFEPLFDQRFNSDSIESSIT